MASIHLEPPSSFPFETPDEWPKWKKRFEQFRLASGLSSEDETRQVSTLLYCMGENAEETLTSTEISDEERKVFMTVVHAKNSLIISLERRSKLKLTTSHLFLFSARHTLIIYQHVSYDFG